MRDVILWLADRGVEGHLAVSIGSLRNSAPVLWKTAAKVVIDCGLSDAMRRFLASKGREGVHVFCAAGPSGCVARAEPPGILAMRSRIRAPLLLERLREEGKLASWRICLVCDADTVFLRDFALPDPTVEADTDLLVMAEWDTTAGVEEPLLFLRQSTFALPTGEVEVARLSEAIDIPERVLVSMPTYNTGVLAFAAGACFVGNWNREYETLISVTDEAGRGVFSRFAAEQNALALAIQRGTVLASPLARCFNQLPPRPPQSWPEDTAIAHFVTFGRNHREGRYALWFRTRDRVRDDGWIPRQLVPAIRAPHDV